MKKSWKRGLALYLSFVMAAGNFGSGISYSFAAVNGGGGTGTGKATSSNAAGSGSGHTHTSKATSSNADSGSSDREPDKMATESNATMSNALKLLLEKTEFSLSDDFSNTQGPVWYYKYGDKDSGKISELQEYDAATPRWMDNKDKYLRIFKDGMMPGNKGDDAILEWIAPADGLVQISEHDGSISMETDRNDRDGVLLSIQQNGKLIWPDTGTISTEHNKKDVNFQPFYLQVREGDAIHFRANGNKEYNNDRVKWCPVITYLEEEDVAMIFDITMTGRDSLEFTAASKELYGDIQDRISLSAIVNGKKEEAVTVRSAEAKDGKAVVTFDEVEAAEKDQIQLLVGLDEDHRFVTYSPQDFAVISGQTYYVDAVNGNDSNDGLTEESAWKSLDQINNTTFLPGDSVLLKAGCIWNGYLYPKGEGSESAPVTLGKYGGDGYPIINGDGSVPYDSQYKVRKDFVYSPTVLLSDQSNWVIDGIEVTNSADDSYNHVGILVFTTGRTGVVSNVTVQNCYVHDVTAEVANSKMTGGILVIGADVWIDGRKPEGEMASDIGFDEVLIENNYVKNVAKEGIRSSGQNTGAEGVGFRNTKTFRNITFRGNYIEEIFGDGIVLAEVGENGMVENNVVKNHCNYDTANYAGAWLWQCDDSIFRYNEVFGGEYGYNDGEAFDYDIGCKDIIYEYNYSHHNKGGLLLTMYDNAFPL